jgi:hypothetical protein
VHAPDRLLLFDADPAQTAAPRSCWLRDAGPLHDLIAAEGGFTVDQREGVLLRSGIAVCADPGLTRTFPYWDWNDGVVRSWLRAVRPRLAAGDVQLGGWFDASDGSVSLEPVWVLPEHLQPAALALGRLHRQRAVFDLRRRQVIAVDRGRIR